MKKIIQILPSLDNSGGGVERGSLDVAKKLAENGYDSYLMSSGGDMSEKYKHKGVKNIYLPLKKKSIFSILKLRSDFLKIISELKPDLVHIRSRWPANCFNGILKKLKIPIVTTYHGTYSGNKNYFKRNYNRAMVDGDKVIAISDFISKEILKFFPKEKKKIVVINRGIDTNYFDPQSINETRKLNAISSLGIHESPHIILLPGRLTRWKGHLVAIKSAKIIKNLRPDLNFVFLIVGSHQNRESYKNILYKQVKRNGLESNIIFSGSMIDMPAIYTLADIVLSTSIEPEAFGRVSCEASSMTKPVIASNLGASKDIILNNKTGWLVNPNDEKDLAEKILEVLDLSQEKKDLVGSNARTRVKQNFNINSMLDKTLNLYEELLQKK